MKALLLALFLSVSALYTSPSYEVAVERDVVYATADGYWSRAPQGAPQEVKRLLSEMQTPKPLKLQADIYTPVADSSESRPLLVMLHGGAFLMGYKEETAHVAWCQYFASLGYVAVSLDYRMGFHPNKNSYAAAEQAAVEDLEQALAYLLTRKDLRIDPERVFLAGTSAGAATALSVAYRPLQENAPYRIRAVANCWGYVHSLDILDNARVPILSFQSKKDPVVPYRKGYPMNMFFVGNCYGTAKVTERATALGIRSELHTYPEKEHRLQIDKQGQLTPHYYEIRDRMASFFAECMEEDLPAQGILHSDAVQPAVAGEEGTAVDNHHVPVGESQL